MYVADNNEMVFDMASLVDVIVGAVKNVNPEILDTSEANDTVLAGIATSSLTSKLEAKAKYVK